MEKVRRRPLEEPDRLDVQVPWPHPEPIPLSEHAVSGPQPPKYQQPGLFDS
jgi:hypothetical protein